MRVRPASVLLLFLCDFLLPLATFMALTGAWWRGFLVLTRFQENGKRGYSR